MPRTPTPVSGLWMLVQSEIVPVVSRLLAASTCGNTIPVQKQTRFSGVPLPAKGAWNGTRDRSFDEVAEAAGNDYPPVGPSSLAREAGVL
jgi:hypothetical protein